MAARQTVQIGHPALRKDNQNISDFNSAETKETVIDLKDTMKVKKSVGLAAPQIKKNFNIFVTEIRKTKFRNLSHDEFRAYINPKIIHFSKKQSIIFEGCFSVMNGQIFGPVKRPSEITIEAYNERGKKFQLRCNGILARVIQHEYDHLLGIEFLEKIYDYKQLMTHRYYKQNIRNSKEEQEASKTTVLDFKYIK
ncbi:peptide deformylase [Patescibacteria group bacterium]|nr:peptide deformylase [Patescibacteria group bacterium]